jgi:hypothetical protein
MKRKRNEPDTRCDWHNPSMPVIGKSGREIDHTKMTLKAQMSMELSTEPEWNEDPTYNLRKDRS